MDSILNLISRFDWWLLDAIQHLRSDFLDFLMPKITALGNAGILWILLTLVLLCIPKTRKCGFAMALALVLSLVLGNLVLKPWVARLRPFLENSQIILLIPPPLDFSFPSGHTYAGIASALVLWRFHRRLGIPAMIAAVLIAFSRMYLQVHFPTDILGGILLGTLCAALSVWIVERFCRRKNVL